MAIQIQTLKRVFKYNGMSLPDPAADMTPEDVRDLYSATYAELATASVEGPETKGGQLVYSFRKAVGTKG
jgi:PRTRC genetic system protein C